MSEKQNGIDVFEIWKRYEQGKDYQYKTDLLDRTDLYFRFYHGDQWHGINAGDEDLPIANFIKGTVRYKLSVVCQNGMQAVFSPIEPDREGKKRAICDKLNSFFLKKWEKGKLDTLSWGTVKDAAICGTGYLYFGAEADTEAGQIVDNVNIFFADEKDSDIQGQKYIIIRERKFVRDLRKVAVENGISEDDAELIISDEEYREQLGEKQEQDFSPADGTCISLTYMYKDGEGFVHVIKAVRNLIYRPDTVVRQEGEDGELLGGLTKYPLVNFVWEEKKNSARGYGEVEQMVPNQLLVNKTLARRAIAIKNTAFPKLAYNSMAIQNVDDIVKAGAKIGFEDGNGLGLGSIIGYISPSHTSPDAKNLTDELIQQTRDLAGAGDAATGAIDPTKASGAAIIAVRDQSALPLNEQMARYSQFVEDLAYLWFDMWKAYNPNGLKIVYDNPETGEEVQGFIDKKALRDLEVTVRVDVSKKSAYDRYAQEQSLQNLFAMGAITLEEYVDALENDSVMPKGKLEMIIRKRGQQEALQAQMTQVVQENEELKAVLNQLLAGTPAVPSAQGVPMGMPPEMMGGGLPMV